MKISKKHVILISIAVLILLASIGMTLFLLFSNYQNIRLFKQAQNNFQRGDEESLSTAEAQLLEVIRNDSDNETAFIMLGEIASRRKIYPEQVYYCHMAYRLNPLSSENKEKYIRSLCYARYFDRLENFLSQDNLLSDTNSQLLLYAAGHNGNIDKYTQKLRRRDKDNRIGELALLLFVHKHLANEEKLFALEWLKANDDAFIQQEILVAQTELHLAMQNIDNAEKTMLAAYKLNPYAFAAPLGRFYAQYRNLQKALDVFEKHLALYHDQSAAIQTAEIYCLLNRTDKIAKIREQYQADSGSRAMLCSFYFDALIALANKDMSALKELSAPLRENINSPLASFIFFCADVQSDTPSAILSSYNSLSADGIYYGLQEQADKILSSYLKGAFARNRNNMDALIPLAAALHNRKPELFTAKLIMLAQKGTGSVNIVLLKDTLKRFGYDQGVLKIAIEYYLQHETTEAERLIANFKKQFPAKKSDMFRYEIILGMKKKDYDTVSKLFKENFSDEILDEYWKFATTLMREDDLLFLSRNKFYQPFCQAFLMLKKGEKKAACDILEKADAKNNLPLLFFAAKTLGENGRNQAALKKYSLFPKNSRFTLTVLLNSAELHADSGDLETALKLSRQAYTMAPDLQETQLCYADKLHRSGKNTDIPDIVKLTPTSIYRKQMKKLWILGIESRIKECNIKTQQEKIRELCRQLQVVDPDNDTALKYLKKLNKMPQ